MGNCPRAMQTSGVHRMTVMPSSHPAAVYICILLQSILVTKISGKLCVSKLGLGFGHLQ